ncbi:hypothetical protein BDR04DRAFT_1171595 [Suillus decipiens]|nr:hypothetical protein BDR04DRAFT_1171595 [Suillus decipiens]
MCEDPCRWFAFGITIEGMKLRLWLSNRAFVAAPEPIDLFEGRCIALHVRVLIDMREVDRQSEGEILEKIIASCEKKLQPGEVVDAKRYFVEVHLWEDVVIDGAQDVTLKPVVEDKLWKWVAIDLKPALSERPHLPSTSDMPDFHCLSAFLPTQLDTVGQKETCILRRVHGCTVFEDVKVAIKDVTSLADNLRCLSGGLKALYYLHKVGWVHRDFSVGNAIWVASDNIGKLGDFEYAKEVDSSASHDVRMGTIHFMAVEVEHQAYMFTPDKLVSVNPHDSGPPDPPFRMNFLHDVESVWWALVWIFFYHTTATTVGDHSFNANLQWEQFQLAFPGVIGRSSRQNFFANSRKL